MFNFPADSIRMQPSGAVNFAKPETLLFKKSLTLAELEFLKSARTMMSELTGENFIHGVPEWMLSSGMQFEIDGWNDRVKIAIDYSNDVVYDLPPQYAQFYYIPEWYHQLVSHLTQTRMQVYTNCGYAVIQISKTMPQTELKNFLLEQLHSLTAYRAWVGAPRCKCHPYIETE